MRKELQNELFDKYPKIFEQKDWDKMKTCMCWGIDTPDEWYKVLNSLCKVLQEEIDIGQMPQIQATQVKEKFGNLCFYYTPHHPFADGAIAVASSMILNKDMYEDFDFL